MKDAGWTVEPGDEQFEGAAKHCFITGTSKSRPHEFHVTDLDPIKHGVTERMINNWVDDDVGDHFQLIITLR
jgi:hypothetical protein